jgi:hypothetical protein
LDFFDDFLKRIYWVLKDILVMYIFDPIFIWISNWISGRKNKNKILFLSYLEWLVLLVFLGIVYLLI